MGINCTDENYMENDVACLTTTGDILVLSLPQLRQQMKVEGIKCDSRQNKMASTCFINTQQLTMALLPLLCFLVRVVNIVIQVSLSLAYVRKMAVKTKDDCVVVYC